MSFILKVEKFFLLKTFRLSLAETDDDDDVF